MYWRLKIKPDFQNGRNNDRNSAGGYWEVSRREPNRVSITISRNSWRPGDPEVGGTGGHRKNDNGPTQPEGNITNQASKQLEVAGVCDIHLVPPPPPTFWTSAAPAIAPHLPPAPFGPPTFLPPGPPPAPLHPNSLGSCMAAVSYPPDAPPPYFNYAAPQNPPGQDPGLRNMPSVQPHCAQTPGARPAPPRNSNDGATKASPHVKSKAPKWRWFSLGARSPIVGHARTLSDSSAGSTRSRSHSPPPPSVSQSTRGHGIDGPRRFPEMRQRSSSLRELQARQHRQLSLQHLHSGAQRQQDDNSLSQFESSPDSSYINTSVEAVYDNREPDTGLRRHARRTSNPKRHSGCSRGRESRLAPSEPVLSSYRHHQRLSSSPSPRRRPSPDLQFPSPERRRARVSFELPRGSEKEISSSSWRTQRRRPSRDQSHDSWRENNSG